MTTTSSCKWVQATTDHSSTDKVETTLGWQEHFSQFKDTTDALPCRIYLPVYLWIMGTHSRAAKNTSHGNEVLPQDTTHLVQRPCYQQGSLCQDPASNWTTWRPSDNRKEMQTAVVRTRLLFIRPDQHHLARHSERGDMAGKRRGGKTISGKGQAWSSASPRGQWRTEKWRKLVVKSSLVPQRSSWLKNRWWWW